MDDGFDIDEERSLTPESSPAMGPQGVVSVAGKLIDGRYEIVSELGRGGMGAVYKVLDRSLNDEVVALKLLYPQHVKDPTTLARFRNEVLVARKLSHPNVTKIFDFGEDGLGTAYLSMEFVKGKSFNQYIYAPSHERLVFAEILNIIYKVVLGAEHAHRHGVVHRDLKPDNILISSLGEVKVTDFGLARLLEADHGLTQSGEAVGTPYYMAPEQLRGCKVDQRGDIYALGIIAFEAACGRRPFQDDSYLQLAAMHLRTPMPRIRDFNAGLPGWYEEFVQICGEKRPEDRFQTMGEVREYIDQYRSDLGSNTVSRPVISQAMTSAKSNHYRGRGRSLKQKKKRRSLIKGLCFFALLLGVLTMIRTNDFMNRKALGLILGAEFALNTEFSALKGLLGSQLKLETSSLFEAIETDDLKSIKILLDGGISPNTKNTGGESILNWSLSEGKVEVSSLLIDYGAEANTPNSKGQTPLILAVINGDDELVTKILKSGAEVNLQDRMNRSALVLAAKKGDTSIVGSLIQSGAIVNSIDAYGLSPLYYSVESGSLESSRLLVEAGAELDIQDKDGMSPLFRAVQNDDHEIMNLLVESGANSKLRDVLNRPLSKHASRSTRKVLDRLIEEKLIDDKSKIKFIKKGEKIFDSRGPGESSSAGGLSKVGNKLTEKADSAIELTRLRSVGEPEGVFHFGGGSVKLKSIELNIINAGEVTAEDIVVNVKIPGGKSLVLSGPRSLSRKDRAVWKGDFDEDLTRSYHRSRKKLVEVISCKNCR